MKPTMNTLDFVRTVIQKFTDGQIAIWLFGGWAEELHGERSPGQHHDVDLLYPATDFHQLDEWLSVTGDLLPIQTKRISHIIFPYSYFVFALISLML